MNTCSQIKPEPEVDVCNIKKLLEYKPGKTIEIYTRVSKKSLAKNKSPLYAISNTNQLDLYKLKANADRRNKNN